jgi:hypothetical protein
LKIPAVEGCNDHFYIDIFFDIHVFIDIYSMRWCVGTRSASTSSLNRNKTKPQKAQTSKRPNRRLPTRTNLHQDHRKSKARRRAFRRAAGHPAAQRNG